MQGVLDVAAVDALTERSPDGVLWSRVNTAEAAPGVLYPITWSFYGPTLEVAARVGFADMGLIPRSEAIRLPSIEDRMFGLFYGRFSLNVNVVRGIMSALPGVTGDDVERDIMGSARAGVVDLDTSGRLPVILCKLPWQLAYGARQPPRVRAGAQRWWTERVGRDGPSPGVDPRELLRESLARFAGAIRYQALMRMMLQGFGAQLLAVAERAGQPAAVASLMAGAAGIEEATVADDLWLLARGQLSMDAFLARHGFHGPNGGDVAARSWREDTGPLERLLPTIGAAESPGERRARAGAERAHVAASVLGALPARRRATARALLRWAPSAPRGLERTKNAFLIAIDGGRAAVRAIGASMADAGALDDPDDAFHLFSEELLGPVPPGVRELVAERRELRGHCLAVEIPETWEGNPAPSSERRTGDASVSSVTGAGVSPGVAEGRVRIVLDPADEIDIELGDVLVCPTTDPGWVSLMTIASALVIDIGASASHGAIVARELGVPCVIGTRTGTVDLCDGDLVRVDGAAGVVYVISRAGAGA